jgi:RNA polymerase sigma-70 factor (ECF subfamily)
MSLAEANPPDAKLEDASPQARQAAADRATLAAVARGEKAAFTQLYDRLSGPLYSLCLRMLGDAAEAEDVLQEAFVQIWKRSQAYDPAQSSVFGWSIHITRCKVIDRLRSRHRRLRVFVSNDDDAPENASSRETLASESNDPADRLDRNEQAAQVRRVLRELPVEQRQAIELAFFSDLSHHEISTRLSQPLGTIKARIRRGLLRLRDGLKQKL